MNNEEKAMNNEEKDIDLTAVPASNSEESSPLAYTGTEEDDESLAPVDSIDNDIAELEDDIIRNDTIPETSRDTPGSSGAFPVGAFDTSKG